MIKIHVLHTGTVRVSPYLPFGGEHSNILKASGFTTPKKDWVWLPVSCYLIEHPKGKVLLYTDGGYATKSWQEMILPGIAWDKALVRRSLEWIREQCSHPDCIESLATHDAAVPPHVIEL